MDIKQSPEGKLLIDIHCHLDHFSFNPDRDAVIERAKEAGVKIILTNGINPETNRISLELSKKYPLVRAAMGIYPIHALQKDIQTGAYPLKPNVFDVDEEIDFIEKNKGNIAAVGECGLDGLDPEHMPEQKTVFEKMIALAEKLKKPLVVHSRRAEQEALDMLASSSLKKVLLHCFSGKKNAVKRGIDAGFCFSLPTNIVRAQNFQWMAEHVPLGQLFCETDAPYLSPFRELNNGRNEPAFVVESYKKIAELKKMEVSEVMNNVWMNWQKMF
ncbi:TatD family hydrolase [Candidatus Woesearchaeota archaeon]|nr:TatD family hydrolase [Candidatus Woesearchaeota archaeon]